jgi:hypothetical protein
MGASDAEVQERYPGAGLVPGGRRSAPMAVTIDAPPSRLWPWLAQMGEPNVHNERILLLDRFLSLE